MGLGLGRGAIAEDKATNGHNERKVAAKPKVLLGAASSGQCSANCVILLMKKSSGQNEQQVQEMKIKQEAGAILICNSSRAKGVPLCLLCVCVRIWQRVCVPCEMKMKIKPKPKNHGTRANKPTT